MIDSGFDPAVIPIVTDVAQLAGIKDSTHVVNQDGLTFTVQEKFELDMVEIIKKAHWLADNDPARLKKAKATRKLGEKFEKALQDGNLSRYLPFSRVRAVSDLVNELYRLERVKKHGRTKKWGQTIRKQFVNGLLNAVETAGGHLGLDRPNGRGTLDETIKLLAPYLPNGAFRHGLSASTLKNIIAVRAKKLQKTV